MSMKNPVLYLVVPCYNEEAVLPKSGKQLLRKLHDLIARKYISEKSRIVFMDDGSQDKTWHIITRLHTTNREIIGLKLSRNRGHQNALLAGLLFAKDSCDVAISLDADLQDDINAIEQMIEKYRDGSDVVYGVRHSRQTDSRFKRNSAKLFYKLMRLLGAESIENHADFRLTSRKVLESLTDFHEVNLFLRGIFPLIGFRSTAVYYERKERLAGESKYSLRSMIRFAINGITSFSVRPLRIITFLGAMIFAASILFAMYLLVEKLLGHTSQGLSFIAISIWFIGGVQMLSLGVVGEYIGKMYVETKARPRYIIEETLL
jgi:glycosyltransferase involved in cell wall biosynthesis